ncbi:hypothetical protein HanXRQr2_Chr04g0184251 [Helianthus annuus]|uniref:Uncharacterized protein n=1 Tax=Helianthus annuus TaxID=4232 RepID=A0A9K3NSY1_HELAN|nr:hypothetical protein HanXRQr2_Chr04g0184251 [Helianthus annuus]KAJ0932790.1 hypothetical protein HanPSC8_Chr04g0177701 [Helianthus annuus]
MSVSLRNCTLMMFGSVKPCWIRNHPSVFTKSTHCSESSSFICKMTVSSLLERMSTGLRLVCIVWTFFIIYCLTSMQ